MVFTEAQAKAAFHHVLDNVLRCNDTSPLKQSLMAMGIENIYDLCMIENDDINDLVYSKSSTETDVPVLKFHKNTLRAFCHYVSYAQDNGNLLLDRKDWEAITEEDFGSDVVHQYCPLFLPKPATFSMASLVPADYSRRWLKRESSKPPVLKDENFSDAGYCCSIAKQASAQDVIALPVADHEEYQTDTMLENSTVTLYVHEVYQKDTMLESSNVTPSDERTGSQTSRGNVEHEKVETECTLLTVTEYSGLTSAPTAYDETNKPMLAKRLAYIQHTGNAQDICDSGGKGKCDIVVAVSEPHASAHDCPPCPWSKQVIKEQAKHTRLTFDRGRQNNNLRVVMTDGTKTTPLARITRFLKSTVHGARRDW